MSEQSLIDTCNKVMDHWVTNLLAAYANCGQEYSESPSDCAFCMRYYRRDICCGNCPVAHVDHGGCSVNRESAYQQLGYQEFGSPGHIRAINHMIRKLEQACDYVLQKG